MDFYMAFTQNFTLKIETLSVKPCYVYLSDLQCSLFLNCVRHMREVAWVQFNSLHLWQRANIKVRQLAALSLLNKGGWDISASTIETDFCRSYRTLRICCMYVTLCFIGYHIMSFQKCHLKTMGWQYDKMDTVDVPPPTFHFHFHAVFGKNWPNNRLAPPASGKSLICHCMLLTFCHLPSQIAVTCWFQFLWTIYFPFAEGGQTLTHFFHGVIPTPFKTPDLLTPDSHHKTSAFKFSFTNLHSMETFFQWLFKNKLLKNLRILVEAFLWIWFHQFAQKHNFKTSVLVWTYVLYIVSPPDQGPGVTFGYTYICQYT